ncbi:MAG: hypothetical protein ACRDV1_02120 [Actinomycetes bacterium]
MPRFLVETYVPRPTSDTLARVAAGADDAARTMAMAGVPVRHLGAIYVPDDETCFHLFEGPSQQAVRDTAEIGGLFSGGGTGAIKLCWELPLKQDRPRRPSLGP